MTINDLFIKCWTDHWNKPRFMLSRHAKVVDGYYRRRIKPEFGSTNLEEITHVDVRMWHQSMEETPYEGNRSLEVLSRLFTFAEETGLVHQGVHPCRGVKAFPERQRDRYATAEEIKRIGEVLESEKAEYPREVTFIYLLMMTGARPVSLSRAKRSELHGSTLVFDGKSTHQTGQKEVIFFPEAAMALINQLPRRSDGRLIGAVSLRDFWARVRTRAGCPDLFVRDWRRTFATHALSSGIDLGVLGRLLNHQSTQTTWRYARLLPAKREEAAEKVAGTMNGILKNGGTR